MMFRRTEEDEESGSDWDELTPRATASPSPAHRAGTSQTVPSPPHQALRIPTRFQTSPPPPPLGHTVLQDTATTTVLQDASITAVAHDATPANLQDTATTTANAVLQDAISFPTLLPRNGTKESTHSLNSLKITVSTSLPNTSTRSKTTDTVVAGMTITPPKPLQDQLTSIATARTPHPPRPRTPPTAKSVYRVEEQEDEEGVAGVGVAGVKERAPASPREGGGGGGGAEGVARGVERANVEDDYKVDLEFTAVTGQKADYLTPTTPQPQAYMSEVAERWEEHSQRCTQEVCSTLRIGSDFVIAVLLGSTHCLLHHVIRKLCCGLGHILADALIKPSAVLLFNGVLWPVLAGCVQLSKGGVLVLAPMLEIVGVLMSWVVQVARSCRLVMISNKHQPNNHKPEHQV